MFAIASAPVVRCSVAPKATKPAAKESKAV